MKMTLLAAAILLSLTTSAQAFTAEKPAKCPSEDVIKTLVIDEADVKPFIDRYVSHETHH